MLGRPMVFVLLVGTTACSSAAGRYCENLLEYELSFPYGCPGSEARELVDLKTCREILKSACEPSELEILQQRVDCAALTICDENDDALVCLAELRETVGEPNDQCESAQDLLYL